MVAKLILARPDAQIWHALSEQLAQSTLHDRLAEEVTELSLRHSTGNGFLDWRPLIPSRYWEVWLL
jgi:hypothetical protein